MKERVPAPPPTGGEATEGWRRGTEGAVVGDLVVAAAARGLALDAAIILLADRIVFLKNPTAEILQTEHAHQIGSLKE